MSTSNAESMLLGERVKAPTFAAALAMALASALEAQPSFEAMTFWPDMSVISGRERTPDTPKGVRPGPTPRSSRFLAPFSVTKPAMNVCGALAGKSPAREIGEMRLVRCGVRRKTGESGPRYAVQDSERSGDKQLPVRKRDNLCDIRRVGA